MSYSENLATENERGALFMLGRLGLPTAAVALGCHASGYGDAFAWLATIIAAADMWSRPGSRPISQSSGTPASWLG